jgi:hypothetical protein
MRTIPLIASLLALLFPLPLVAQSEEEVPLPTVPCTFSETARFFPVAEDLVLPPGGSRRAAPERLRHGARGGASGRTLHAG